MLYIWYYNEFDCIVVSVDEGMTLTDARKIAIDYTKTYFDNFFTSGSISELCDIIATEEPMIPENKNCCVFESN